MSKINILAPTDFSDNSENATKYAVEIAKKLNARIILFHAYSVPVTSPDLPVNFYDKELETVIGAAEDCINELKEDIMKSASGLEIDSVLEEGPAVHHIDDFAKKKKIDLIVMGSKGANGLEAFVFGSVTGKIAERVSCPVLVIPEKAKYRNLNHIVFASNFLDEDIRKIDDLIAFAKPFHSEIRILNVFEGDSEKEKSDVKKFEKALKEHEKYSHLKVQSLKGHDVLLALEAFVKNRKIDLLVMSTRRRFNYERIFNPSLTKQMIFHTEIPLLVLHY